MSFRRRVRFLGAFLLAAAVVQPLSAPTASASGRSCEEVTIPVALLGQTSPHYSVRGTLCLPPGRRPGVVQLLLHGGTYDREYFQFGYREAVYSYTRHANAAGYATLNIDRLGAGASDKPPSADMTPQNVAFVVHQVVQALRTSVNGKRFGWVQGVGHSMGSVALAIEAATYGDVDSVILTGMAHDLSEAGVVGVQSTRYPANLEAPWAGLDSGYLTTLPGTRGDYFYHPPTTSPGAVAHDEATKDVMPVTELLGLELFALTNQIAVPTLVVNGEFDALICGSDGTDCSTSAAMRADEAPFFSAAACMRAVSIPDTGHDLQTSRTALLTSTVLLAWSYLVTGGPSGNGHGCSTVRALWSSTQAPLLNSATALTAAAGS